ncbi:hypothetical protein AAC387_Pa02g1434 [Persea americana]
MTISTLTRSSIISTIRSSTITKSLPYGKSIHAQIIKSGLLTETTVSNHLLNMYAKSSDFVDARILFDEMPERNLVSFSTLISGYSKSGTPQFGLELVNELQKECLVPNQFVFSSLILSCSKLRLVNQGKQIHAQVIISSFESDPFVITSLIDMYLKFGDLDLALSIFSRCVTRDLVMYNSMISGLVNFGSFEGAFEVFLEAQQDDFDLKPTEVTFCSAIKACANLSWEVGGQIHGLCVKSGFDLDCFVGTSLIDMYGRFNDMKSAEMVFRSILFTDIALYNAMIVGYSQNNLDESALEFFFELKLEGFSPNECTFSSMLKACSGLKCLNVGRILHGLIEKSQFRTDLVVKTALIDMYMKCGCVEVSCRVFDSSLIRNTILYNSMIFGHGQNGNFDEAVNLFIDMHHSGLEADLATFVVSMSSCLGHEMNVYVHAIKRGFGSHLMVQNALLDSLIKRGMINEALWLFDNMHEKNVVSWTTFISGLAQLDLDADALKLFKRMQLEGIYPNGFTFSCVLKACGGSASLDQGRCIHGFSIKHGIVDEEFTKSSLLDMYAKCGALEESYRLFEELPKSNIVIWNSMISGYAQHGYGSEALQLLVRMETQGIKPNHVTFVSLLSACSHCGLVDEGIHIFESMTSKHGITPSMEHYACMVDIFGRAGMLDQAKCLIDGMPFEPGPLIWRVFLAACKLHGDVKLAQLARTQALRVEGEDNTAFVLMSNIYSEVGNWDDAEKVRKRMKDMRLRKEPGVSWL